MDEQTLRQKASAFGLAKCWDHDQDFRTAFKEQCEGVEDLPPDLIARGRDLPYPQLHAACVDGEVDLVRALLAANVGPDIYTYLNDDEDDTPLERLAKEVDMDFKLKVEIAQLLISQGADVDGAIESAEYEDDEAFADYLRSQAP